MKSALYLILFFGIGLLLKAQVNSEDVLMTIAGKNVTVNEFMAIYQKNNPKGTAIDKKSMDEYLNLYINFKLKVKQAEDLGLDTLTSFKTELKGYRDQLAKPYQIDESEIDKLVKEAYEREHYDIRASHIFIKLTKDAPPEDTLAAYKKIAGINERIHKGEDFGSLAVELSEDPSARDREANQQHPFIKGNRGDLGYFTVFDFIYPFETAAYNTEIGKVSPITRTEYGYHLIKVTDKRKAMGKVTVAHIFMTIPRDATASDSARVRLKIDSVYRKLLMGAKWDTMVKQYSEDKGSAMKGGVLPKFGVNKLVPEFIQVVYKLENKGDFSEPFLTSYGWHIVKLVDRQIPGPLETGKEAVSSKTGTIFFKKGKYDLDLNYGINKTQQVQDGLANLNASLMKGWKIKDILIDGWASPEGSGSLNEKLSENRSMTGRTYIISQIRAVVELIQKDNKDKKAIKAMADAAVKDVSFITHFHGPDWNGLSRNVQGSNIKDKDKILGMINSTDNEAKKEQEIRNMLALYPELENDLLPPLRRIEITASLYETKSSDNQAEMADLKKKINNDPRNEVAKNALYNKIKKEYGFKEYPEAKAAFYKVVTDTIFAGKWDISLAKELDKNLFKIGSRVFTQQDFARYLSNNQRKREKQDIKVFVDQQYNVFVTDNLLKWENEHLEQKYPDFKNLMTEYRDGILLFNLTDEKVWSKAVKDTTGLKEFYERNKSNYVWGTRLEATIYTLKDQKLEQKVKNFIKSGLADQDILKELNNDSLKVLTIENGKFSKKDNKYIDEIPWVPGMSQDLKADSVSSAIVFVNVKQVLKPETKSLNEARGLITADYQNYLEKIWIQYLRQKYPVIINKEVLAKIR